MTVGYSLHYTSGVITSSPRRPRPGKYPVLLLHGFTGNARSWNVGSSYRTGYFFKKLCAAGFSAMTVSTGDGFGNAAHANTCETARGIFGTSMPWCDNSKMVIVGLSMGNAGAWAYRRDYPTRVAGIVGLMPCSNLQDGRVRDTATGLTGLRAAIDAAWTVTYPAALPAAGDFVGNAATLRGIPYWAYYSTADNVVLPADVTALATALGGTAVPSGTGAHGDPIMADISISSVIANLIACGA